MSATNQNIREENRWVTLSIGDQLFGLPVHKVQDVLYSPTMTRVPLAPPEIAGLLNLRGHIVTAIDMSVLLNHQHKVPEEKRMCAVLEEDGELYSLVVDYVKEVLTLPSNLMESNPPTLPENWRDISMGIFQLEDNLMIAVDPNKLFNLLGI